MEENKIGKVTHYFGNISVGIIEMTDGTIRIGDTIHFKGKTTDFTQTVESMQIEHQNVDQAQAGDTVGLKVKEHVRQQDIVYKVVG